MYDCWGCSGAFFLPQARASAKYCQPLPRNFPVVTLFAASPGAAGSNDSIAGHGRPIVVAKTIFPGVMKSDALTTVWAAAHIAEPQS